MLMTARKHYPPEKAEPLMCVPACLNMIFRRRGLEPIPQKLIAVELGLVVPLRLQNSFPLACISEDSRDWGVHPQDERTSLKGFFDRQRIPLEEKFYLSSQIPTSFGYAEFLSLALESGNDVIVGYDYATVFRSGGNVGHVSLICDVDSAKDVAWILDPESADEGPMHVLLRDLVAGVRTQRDGFWIIGPHEAVRQCAEVI